jgi:uncharacterized membrane protein YcaP (DUF421 family)
MAAEPARSTSLDWSELFVPSGSILEIVVRGMVIYFVILCILRILRREAGEIGRADLIVLLLVADAAQSGLAGQYRSITEAIVLISTIFGWNHLLDWLSFRSEAIHRLLEPPPLLVVRDGRIIRRSLRSEFLRPEDLEEQLRKQGIASLAEVRRCYIEADGRVSVIRRAQPGA